MQSTKFDTNENYSNFKLVKSEIIPELKFGASGDANKYSAHEFIHKSGAKLLFLENDDPEMAFSIGFKTLPKDSTGVFHILEHSVLCGSRKFRVKEPFTNLLKSSMQTFLNAMTFPDKTMYPVASTNTKDLYNLIDVYMDAVFFPNIYKNINIFYQEGGHPTVENDGKQAGFNGVVFNEMKGVYSEPSEHLFCGLLEELFPGSCYSYSSGGDPKIIPSLNYENYLKQHNTNYRPENAYIIVYGNLDIYKMFEFLDSNYLSVADEINNWRAGITTCVQGSFEHVKNNNSKTRPKKIKVKTTKEHAECGAAFCFERDHKKFLATKILLNAIANSNESPLMKALLDDGFATDIEFDLLTEVNEPLVYVECKGVIDNAGERFIKKLTQNIKKITAKGIQKDLLRAAISHLEFKFREKVPCYTNGIDNAISIMSEWLYDDTASTSAIKYEDEITWLKEKIDTDYFDELADEIFIDNENCALVEITPCETDNNTWLVDINQSEAKEIQKICDELQAWQEKPDSKENEAELPVMKKSDIGKGPQTPSYQQLEVQVPSIKYDMQQPGISYINRYYSLNALTSDELPYVSLLCCLLGKLDTKNYKSHEIDVIAQEKLGACAISPTFYDNNTNIFDLSLNVSVLTSALEENTKYLASFVDEILLNTRFDDTEKIKTILLQNKVNLEQSYISSGHVASLNRALSYILPVQKARELTHGIDFYFFLKDLMKNYDKNKDKLASKLKEISNKIFNYKPTISFVTSESSINEFFDNFNYENLKEAEKFSFDFKCENKQEAFIIPSNVNYCSMANDMRFYDFCDKSVGHSVVASKIISLDYLWNQVRVKNGAYGAGMLVNNKGITQYYSFRDPKILDTYSSYQNSGQWLKDADISGQTLDNYIISSVAKIDAPMTTKDIMTMLDNYYFTKTNFNIRETIRNQMINTASKDIKSAADIFIALNKDAAKCILGGDDVKNLEGQDFKIIDLFND